MALLGAGRVLRARGHGSTHHLAWFMTATAGMFIYIAGTDLIPQLHHHREGPGAMVYLPFLGGIALIATVGAARRTLRARRGAGAARCR